MKSYVYAYLESAILYLASLMFPIMYQNYISNNILISFIIWISLIIAANLAAIKAQLFENDYNNKVIKEVKQHDRSAKL